MHTYSKIRFRDISRAFFHLKMRKKLAARAAGGAAARRLRSFAKAPAHRLRRGAKEGTGEVVS